MTFQFTKEDQILELHPNIAKHLPKFISNRIKDYESLKLAVEEANFVFIRSYCHKTVGVAASYNFFKLEELTISISEYARVEDLKSIKYLLITFDQYISEIRSYLSPN